MEQNWENKWDDFKNEDIQNELEQEGQHDQAVEATLDWCNAHEEEVKQAFKTSEDSGEYPKDTISGYELDIDAGGHQLYFRMESWMDRDGGNEDSEIREFSVDGQDCLHYGTFGKQSKAELALEFYLTSFVESLE